MEIITRQGPRSISQAEFDQLRSGYASTLVDLGTGDGAWPRRFAREFGNCLAIGVDSDRDALREAARLAGRKPTRGGAPNACFVAARVEELPEELCGAADWVTIYFPWAALLRMILSGDDALTTLLNTLCAPRARLSLVLNAEATPDGFDLPTPASLRRSLEAPLEAAGFRVGRVEWLSADNAPATTWSGRLVKGSKRQIIALEAQR